MARVRETAAQKEARVIEAAARVFRRLGFARTSMEAIASEAGMSRPALYLVFPGKDEIFAATVEHLGQALLEELRDGAAGLSSPGERLAAICRRWVVEGFERAAEHPEQRDLTDPGREPVKQVYLRLESLVEGEIAALGTSRPSAAAVARMLVASMRGLKDAAGSVEEARALIDLQIALVLAGLRAEQGQRDEKAAAEALGTPPPPRA